MAKPLPPITPDQVGHDPMPQLLHDEGLTMRAYVRALKKELKAMKRSRLKIDGAFNTETTYRIPRVVGTTGQKEYGPDGEKIYSTGETILEFSDEDWMARRAARVELGNHLGISASPPAGVQVEGDLNMVSIGKIDLNLDQFREGLKRICGRTATNKPTTKPKQMKEE
jgi:hypothetical protein